VTEIEREQQKEGREGRKKEKQKRPITPLLLFPFVSSFFLSLLFLLALSFSCSSLTDSLSFLIKVLSSSSTQKPVVRSAHSRDTRTIWRWSSCQVDRIQEELRREKRGEKREKKREQKRREEKRRAEKRREERTLCLGL
jgi:hypothetical protein